MEPSSTAAFSPRSQELAQLARDIVANEPTAGERLYRLMLKQFRYYLVQQVGVQEWEDLLHLAYVDVLIHVRRGDLREPRLLLGYAAAIVKCKIYAQIGRRVSARIATDMETSQAFHTERIGDNPLKALIQKYETSVMLTALNELSSADQEILRRFYLLRQSKEAICAEMRLTETQFRLRKSRAKARLAKRAQIAPRRKKESA